MIARRAQAPAHGGWMGARISCSLFMTARSCGCNELEARVPVPIRGGRRQVNYELPAPAVIRLRIMLVLYHLTAACTVSQSLPICHGVIDYLFALRSSHIGRRLFWHR
jgi:hypothetical protein